jgi:hypothetical protein
MASPGVGHTARSDTPINSIAKQPIKLSLGPGPREIDQRSIYHPVRETVSACGAEYWMPVPHPAEASGCGSGKIRTVTNAQHRRILQLIVEQAQNEALFFAA